MRRRTLIQALLPALAGLLPMPDTHAAVPGDDWFIFLETGRPPPDDAPALQAMQGRHIDNFKRLFALGRLLAAGPLRDPSRHKRGIVVVRAASLDELRSYFQPDDYVREGYMQVDAVRAVPRRPMHTVGIDPERVEELRIVLIDRPAAPTSAGIDQQRQDLLQRLVERGTLGAWYTLADGPIAEVLLARGTDDDALRSALAPYPGLADGSVRLAIWPQWLSQGAVGPR